MPPRWLLALRPDEVCASVYDLDLDGLWARGIRGLIFDLDNTLTEWRVGPLRPELAEWFGRLRAAGFQACILSNNAPPRVDLFARGLGVPGVPNAGKPLARAFNAAMRLTGTEPAATAVVGDQIFTDVWGAKRRGLYTILVPPLSARDFRGTRLMRHLERLVLAGLRRHGLLGDWPPPRA